MLRSASRLAGAVAAATRPHARSGPRACSRPMGGASGGAAQAGRRGAFILFEGVDRCGKTTQSRRLVAHLRALGVRPRRPACAPAVRGRAVAGHGHCDIALTWSLGRVGERPVPGGRAPLRSAGEVRACKSRAGHLRADRVGHGHLEAREWVSWARRRQPQRRAQVYTTQPGCCALCSARWARRCGQGRVCAPLSSFCPLLKKRRVLPARGGRARGRLTKSGRVARAGGCRALAVPRPDDCHRADDRRLPHLQSRGRRRCHAPPLLRQPVGEAVRAGRQPPSRSGRACAHCNASWAR